jgi:hypothetical protein
MLARTIMKRERNRVVKRRILKGYNILTELTFFENTGTLNMLLNTIS